MNTDPKAITSILLSSGNGWFDSEKESAAVFSKPSFSLSFTDKGLKITSDNHIHTFNADPLDLVERYNGAGYHAVGYIGYSYLEHTNRGFKTSREKDGARFPKIFFHFYKEENIENTSLARLKGSAPVEEQKAITGSCSNITKSEYLEKLEKIKKYISAGDIYQVNMSQRFYSDPVSHIIPYFLGFYNTQPVPFAAYIDFTDFQLLSGSMELFLRKSGKTVLTKPIKGTSKRGSSEAEDEILMKNLKESEKERAENLMIVDLMRNDIGRICEYGSVRVNRLFDINTYETLFQMESEVEGVLKEGLTLSEIVYNTFPPGSVTGAPKRRALEIIDEIEPHYRGPYCGAVCYIKPDGDFSMSVGIRVKVNTPERSIFWVGGGIVWDSDPEAEYEETLLKSSAIRETDSTMLRQSPLK